MIDALKLFPLPDDCNIFYLCYVKDVLVGQFGIDEGFKIYREQLSPQKSINRSRPQRIVSKQVASLRDIAAAKSISFDEIHPGGETFVIPSPRVIGDGDWHPLTGTARSSYVACLSNARIHARSPFLGVDGSLVLDYERRELLDTDDRWNVDHYLFSADGDVAWEIQYDQPVIEIDEAFGSLLGTSTMSWGHWLGDYVPRYVSAVLSGHLPRVPVLIDAGMPATHRQLLELVMPEGTEIIELSPEHEVRVRRLWCAPSPGYAPFLPRFNEKFAWDKFCTVPARWTPVLTEMGQAVDNMSTTPTGHTMERLFLGRKPYRWTKLLNCEAIESLARARGFTIVYPEDYPLRELAKYVRSARYVVGPVGSQMINTYFARPGAHVCYLTHPLLLGAWPYPLGAIGIDVTMITGPVVNLNNAPEPPTFGYPHHADYEIDPNRFAGFLDEWLDDYSLSGSVPEGR